MPNKKNIEQVDQITSQLQNSGGVVFLNYKGLSVKQVEELRNTVEAVGGSLSIVKNTLLRIALRKSGIVPNETPDKLTEPTATLYLGEDIIAPLKTLRDFAKANEQLGIKGGVVESRFVGADDIVTLSNLPSYNELIAKLLGQLQAPIRNLAFVLSGVNRSLVYALSRIHESKGGEQ